MGPERTEKINKLETKDENKSKECDECEKAPGLENSAPRVGAAAGKLKTRVPCALPPAPREGKKEAAGFTEKRRKRKFRGGQEATTATGPEQRMAGGSSRRREKRHRPESAPRRPPCARAAWAGWDLPEGGGKRRPHPSQPPEAAPGLRAPVALGQEEDVQGKARDWE